MTGREHARRARDPAALDARVRRPPTHPLAALQRAVGNQAVLGLLQRKGAPQDPDERRKAEQERAGGSPLPGASARAMGASFGADFSPVRVHEGPGADALGARAYTSGEGIHF